MDTHKDLHVTAVISTPDVCWALGACADHCRLLADAGLDIRGSVVASRCGVHPLLRASAPASTVTSRGEQNGCGRNYVRRYRPAHVTPVSAIPVQGPPAGKHGARTPRPYSAVPGDIDAIAAFHTQMTRHWHGAEKPQPVHASPDGDEPDCKPVATTRPPETLLPGRPLRRPYPRQELSVLCSARGIYAGAARKSGLYRD